MDSLLTHWPAWLKQFFSPSLPCLICALCSIRKQNLKLCCSLVVTDVTSLQKKFLPWDKKWMNERTETQVWRIWMQFKGNRIHQQDWDFAQIWLEFDFFLSKGQGSTSLWHHNPQQITNLWQSFNTIRGLRGPYSWTGDNNLHSNCWRTKVSILLLQGLYVYLISKL